MNFPVWMLQKRMNEHNRVFTWWHFHCIWIRNSWLVEKRHVSICVGWPEKNTHKNNNLKRFGVYFGNLSAYFWYLSVYFGCLSSVRLIYLFFWQADRMIIEEGPVSIYVADQLFFVSALFSLQVNLLYFFCVYLSKRFSPSLTKEVS